MPHILRAGMRLPVVSPWTLLALGLSAWLLAGCAAPGQPVQAQGVESYSEFDEPESRRRARIRTELAVGYFEQGQTAVALEEIRQAIAADPNYAPAHNLRGLVYLQLNDLGLADTSLQRAVQLSPTDGDALHNLGWLRCQQAAYAAAQSLFERALAVPVYGNASRTLMALGICQARAGQNEAAERSLTRSFELDAGNPITGYNLAKLLYQRGDFSRAQFYIRRLNNSELANAETLWLGLRVERRLQNADAARQLGEQLRRRYPQSDEFAAFQRGAFDD